MTWRIERSSDGDFEDFVRSFPAQFRVNVTVFPASGVVCKAAKRGQLIPCAELQTCNRIQSNHPKPKQLRDKRSGT
jgi:hypothetical protein